MSIGRMSGAVAVAAAIGLGGGSLMTESQAHHSFAMYDGSQILVFTGVVTRVHPDANHLQIYFAPMNEERDGVVRDEDGQPVIWAVEMQGAAGAARQGVSVNEFPPGTIFSVGMHPLRSGVRAGERTGGLFRCPERTPPTPDAHCDSVEGSTSHGAVRGSDELPEEGELDEPVDDQAPLS